MIPLIVLVGSFLLLLAVRVLYKELTLEWAGRIAFSVMILFTGSSHFYLTEGMVMSMPPFLPAKQALVYFTGALEIGLGLALVVTKRPVMVAWLLLAYLVAVFPANVYATLNHVDIENATHTGPGPSYLFFRAPLQLFFMAWVYYFGIHKPQQQRRAHHWPQLTIVRGTGGHVDVIEEGTRVSDRSHIWD
jgi:uncharacterized membrane protein